DSPIKLPTSPNMTNASASFRKDGCATLFTGTFILFFSGGLLAGSRQHADSRSSPSKPRWVLTWSDEFNGPTGSTPDPAKWVVESGGNGWGNDELEYY